MGKFKQLDFIKGADLKLTTEVIDRICQAKARGISDKESAKFAGVSEHTLYKWKQLGKKQKYGPYRKLLEKMEAAKSSLLISTLDNIRLIGKGGRVVVEERYDKKGRLKSTIKRTLVSDLKANIWIMENKFPEECKSKTNINIEGDIRTQGTLVVPGRLSVEEWEKLIAEPVINKIEESKKVIKVDEES